MTFKELIVCAKCSAEYGPTEVRHVCRVTCDRCGSLHDADQWQVPPLWSHVQESNVQKYTLCPECSEALKAFCTRHAAGVPK